MNDLTIGILLGAFLYSTYITLVAVITQDEDSIIVCGIGVWWLFYGVNILLKKYILPEIRRYRTKRTFTGRKRYEQNCKIWKSKFKPV